LAEGKSVDNISSVASVFVSRIDAAVDAQLVAMGGPAAESLKTKTAIANAKIAYGHFQNIFHSGAWAKLEAAGAKPQRILWASTSPKDPALSDTYYVEALIAEQTVNTLPPATLAAYREDGEPSVTLSEGLAEAHEHMERLASLGIDLPAVTKKLEEDGLASFQQSFDNLLNVIDDKRAKLQSSAD